MSANPQLKTPGQVRAIFGLAKQRGLDEDELRALVEEVTKRKVPAGRTGVATLNLTQADALIVKLGGRSLAARRTIQQRHKNAGVQQLAGPNQLEYMRRLATARGWSEETLADFCFRQCRHNTPRTTRQANQVIEALKSMNRRDSLWY